MPTIYEAVAKGRHVDEKNYILNNVPNEHIVCISYYF